VTRIDNHISRYHLSADLSSGTLERVITNPLFHVPLTSVRFGDRLAVVNSHLGHRVAADQPDVRGTRHPRLNRPTPPYARPLPGQYA